jgi:hypothetical protein
MHPTEVPPVESQHRLAIEQYEHYILDQVKLAFGEAPKTLRVQDTGGSITFDIGSQMYKKYLDVDGNKKPLSLDCQFKHTAFQIDPSAEPKEAKEWYVRIYSKSYQFENVTPFAGESIISLADAIEKAEQSLVSGGYNLTSRE